MSITASIENNEYKNKTRVEMVNQILNFGKNINGVTLPAEHFYFEKMLLEKLPNSVLHGYENDYNVYEKALKNKPAKNVHLTYGLIGDNMVKDSDINFAWYDYCGAAYGGKRWGYSRIEEPARFIRNCIKSNKQAMCYVTYCLTSRFMSVEGMANIIWKKLSLVGAIKRRLWSEIGRNKGIGVHLVFESQYLGGDGLKTPMITLGFQVGEKTVKDFNANWVEEIREDRKENNVLKNPKRVITDEQVDIISDIVLEQQTVYHKLVNDIKKYEDVLNNLTNSINGTIFKMDNKDFIKFGYEKGLTAEMIFEMSKFVPKHLDCKINRNITRKAISGKLVWLKREKC